MWIMTQTNLILVNTDQCVDIFIDKTGTKIYAEVTVDRDFVELGCYKDRDTCKKILRNILLEAASMHLLTYYIMPLGGEV